jgi:hypothetical protein
MKQYMDKGLGRKTWAFAGGHIPLESTGKEPEFTSHDKVAVLNTSDKAIEIRMTVFFEDEDSSRDYTVTIPARRVRKIRFNDLIDPLPIPLDKPFAFTIHAEVNIVVQFSRMDTRSVNVASFCVTPFSLPKHE